MSRQMQTSKVRVKQEVTNTTHMLRDEPSAVLRPLNTRGGDAGSGGHGGRGGSGGGFGSGNDTGEGGGRAATSLTGASGGGEGEGGGLGEGAITKDVDVVMPETDKTVTDKATEASEGKLW